MKRIKKWNTPDLNQTLTPKLLGEAIKAKRTQSQLRLEDAAAFCGMAKQTWMNIERGKEGTQFESVLKACASIGIKLHILPWDDEVHNDWQ